MLKMLQIATRFVKKLYKYNIIKWFVKFYSLIFKWYGILMSFRIIKFFWYFNKFIFIGLGLLFTGLNWDSFELFNSIKLGYDSLKLYILSFFNPEIKVISNQVIKTKEDINKILESEEKVTDEIELPKPEKKTLVTIDKDDKKTFFQSLRDHYRSENENKITIGDNLGN